MLENATEVTSTTLTKLQYLQVLLERITKSEDETVMGVVITIARNYFRDHGRDIIHYKGLKDVFEKYLFDDTVRMMFLHEGGREAFIALVTYLPSALNLLQPVNTYDADFCHKMYEYLMTLESEILSTRLECGVYPNERDLDDLFEVYFYALELGNFFNCRFSKFEESMENLLVIGNNDEINMVLFLYNQFGKFSESALPLLERLTEYEPFIANALAVLLKYAAKNAEYGTPECYDRILPEPYWLIESEVGSLAEFFLKNPEVYTDNLVEACCRHYAGIMSYKDKVAFALARGDFETSALLLQGESGSKNVTVSPDGSQSEFWVPYGT